jgi:hypothetical protein
VGLLLMNDNYKDPKIQYYVAPGDMAPGVGAPPSFVQKTVVTFWPDPRRRAHPLCRRLSSVFVVIISVLENWCKP